MYSATVIGPPRNLMMLARCASRPLSFLPSSASAPSPCASSMARNRPVRSMAISSARRTEPSGSAASSAPAAGDQPGGGGAAGAEAGEEGSSAPSSRGSSAAPGAPGAEPPADDANPRGGGDARPDEGDARRRRAHHRASPSQGTTQTRPSRERAPASEPAALAAPRRARRAERASATRMRAAGGRERERASGDWESNVIINRAEATSLRAGPGGAHRKTSHGPDWRSPPSSPPPSLDRFDRPVSIDGLARSPFKRALVSDRRCGARSTPPFDPVRSRGAHDTPGCSAAEPPGEDLGSLTVHAPRLGGIANPHPFEIRASRTHGSLRRPPLRAPPPRTPGLARATPKRLAPRLSPRGRT